VLVCSESTAAGHQQRGSTAYWCVLGRAHRQLEQLLDVQEPLVQPQQA
jgi:hypothetical protein